MQGSGSSSEQRLVIIRAMAREILVSWGRYGPPRLAIERILVDQKLPWLLELVDKADERRHGEAEWFLRQLEKVQKQRDKFQEQVRELEVELKLWESHTHD